MESRCKKSRVLEGVGSGVLRKEESYPELARRVCKVKKG